MNLWERRWREGQLGFHQTRPNWALERHGPQIFREPEARILVPLAGKSLDLLWLEDRGHAVVGVEIVELAVRSFFEENERPAKVEPLPDAPGRRFESGSIVMLQADIFDVKQQHTGSLGGAFDRAALIALSEVDRPRYVRHVVSLLEPGSPMLVVSLGYEEGAMNGPPYRVPAAEVQALFAGLGRVEKVDERDALAENERFRERGLSWLVESVYRFTKEG